MAGSEARLSTILFKTSTLPIDATATIGGLQGPCAAPAPKSTKKNPASDDRIAGLRQGSEATGHGKAVPHFLKLAATS